MPSTGGASRSLELAVTGVVIVTFIVTQAASQDIFQPPLVVDPDRANTIFFIENDNITLPCKANGIPTPSYQWYRDGQLIQPGPYMTFSTTTGMLSITLASKREQGVFECRASNLIGQERAVGVSYPQVLKEINVERFRKSTSLSVEADEYAAVTLRCRNQGNVVGPSGDIAYKWYLKRKSEQLDMDGGRLFVDSDGSLHFTYTRQSDDLQNRDQYECGIGSKMLDFIVLGSATTLIVKQAAPKEIKPNLLFSNDGVQAGLAGSVNLECVFSGYDISSGNKMPTIVWFDNRGNEIKSQAGKFSLSDENRVLTVSDLGEDDDATYGCQAVSNSGSSRKEQVYLNVTSAPIWVEAPRSQTVTMDGEAAITCHARSLSGEVPPGPPEWTINGQSYDKARRGNAVLSADKTTLTLKNVAKPDDIVCVQCHVTNSVGTTMESACINVILPITIQISCDKCRGQSLDECSCVDWELGPGDALQVRFATTTDPAYKDLLKQEWVVGGTTYRAPELPPKMMFDEATGSYVMNTSGLAEEDLLALGGEYVYRMFHPDDSKAVTIQVRIKGAPPEPTTSSAGFDMWIIGLIIGLVFLVIIIIVIIVACVCRQKQEGVYNLGKKETTAGLDPEKDLERKAFSDLSKPELEFMEEEYDPERSQSQHDLSSDRLVTGHEENTTFA